MARPFMQTIRGGAMALALVGLVASSALAAPPPGRGGPPEGAGPPAGRGPDRPTPVSPVAVSVGDASAVEGSAVAFPITLEPAAATDVTVEYTTNDGTAVAGTDYTAATGQVVIARGTTATTVNVATAANNVDDGDRIFTLDLTAVSNNATVADGSGTGTIDDDDPVDGAPTLDIGDDSVEEGETAMLSLTLSGPSTTNVVVTFSTTDGSASSAPGGATTAQDYEPATGQTVTIPAGDTNATIDVTTYEDLFAGGPSIGGYDEPDETFDVTITGITGDATLSTATGAATGTATILDDDDPPVLTLQPRSETEAHGGLYASAALLGRSSESITVDWTAFAGADDTATPNVDFTPASGTVTFGPGVTTGTNIGLVPFLDDSDIEPDETFTMVISNPSENASIAVGGDTARMTILEDDGVANCAALDNHEDANDTPAGAVQVPPSPDPGSGLPSYACQGDTDWWVIDLPAPVAGTSYEIIVTGPNLGAVTLDAVFEPYGDPTSTEAVAVGTSPDGFVAHYISSGTAGRILVDLTLPDPDPDPDLGVRYVIGYQQLAEPTG